MCHCDEKFSCLKSVWLDAFELGKWKMGSDSTAAPGGPEGDAVGFNRGRRAAMMPRRLGFGSRCTDSRRYPKSGCVLPTPQRLSSNTVADIEIDTQK